MHMFLFYLAKVKMQDISKCMKKNIHFGIKRFTLFHFAFIRLCSSEKFNGKFTFPCIHIYVYKVVLVVKNLPAIAIDIKDMCSVPGSGRSLGEGHENRLQYSCLENPTDRGT